MACERISMQSTTQHWGLASKWEQLLSHHNVSIFPLCHKGIFTLSSRPSILRFRERLIAHITV
jgi:hypothetical protein